MPELSCQLFCNGQGLRYDSAIEKRAPQTQSSKIFYVQYHTLCGRKEYPWLIHVNVLQKPLQYCKVISLQLIKINK